MKRKLEVSLEQAQKLYKEQPEMRELLLTTFSKEELEDIVLKDWEEIIYNSTRSLWFIDECSEILTCNGNPITGDLEVFKNVVPSEKHAKSILAFCQLSMLMNDLGDECKLDWDNDKEKHSIVLQYNNIIVVKSWYKTFKFLSFKTKKVAEAFLKKHENLIKDYFMM